MAEAEVRAMLEASPELASIHPMDARGPDEDIMLLEQSFFSDGARVLTRTCRISACGSSSRTSCPATAT
jgi:hypothetical protein